MVQIKGSIPLSNINIIIINRPAAQMFLLAVESSLISAFRWKPRQIRAACSRMYPIPPVQAWSAPTCGVFLLLFGCFSWLGSVFFRSQTEMRKVWAARRFEKIGKNDHLVHVRGTYHRTASKTFFQSPCWTEKLIWLLVTPPDEISVTCVTPWAR